MFASGFTFSLHELIQFPGSTAIGARAVVDKLDLLTNGHDQWAGVTDDQGFFNVQFYTKCAVLKNLCSSNKKRLQLKFIV